MTDADLAAPTVVERATELYRYFAADGPPNYGHLLYVGISLSALERAKRHLRNASWIAGATRM